MWQIEENPTQRTVCRDCNRYIARGEHRFGNYELKRWYHLDCAVVRNSRAFAPFAKQAAALLGPATQVPAPRAAERNAELEARLLAQPDDDAVAAVFADWLQSVDDPWGELIALELGGKDTAARRVLRQHLDELVGDLPPRMFEWRRGFIHKATLDVLVPSTDAKQILETVFALRAALILRELHAPFLLRRDAVTVINEAAPATVRHLLTWFTANLQYLVMPALEHLTLHNTHFGDAEDLASCLAAAQLPKLVRLNLHGERPLSVPGLAALLDSGLVRQLTWFEIAPNALDEAGANVISARRAQLAHIPVMRFSLALDDVFPAQKAAWLARASEH